ncbi:MAG: isoleucine--tRNA ligase [Deltaproteobacteria bacterium RIFCSPLOWO2_01_44_7]|nr:MAG: isoleucine--tRNA ligase [Deltaproteobacteria bacterium RIFCSPHIGHO2_01_FULL_43_49]OGQ14742.1 MAG: isoleucine--tRNA ligase [Deltaproteobacteria bacterium RIFCSPHIGHO2_02_FULL_44_53]OGQ28128.1 MAG: isoleucine--tRNA ligase [Deltaproteobacteria bacterium RIFCSPHIGHO2_12_FULL_44_21]OGQ31340.1 MAG: isoleucine--tRNA ligase [Deltaproteobacteria bacterium RIFCSPLOWO2_01_FULL_45_74]OGQ39444.1 MAG: isoleucine--tRNA ligase [Deltaproteobacteria bacterium RIFCSPLOWO2_01_44_7]OGQ43332.1 MAG: isoleuci
MKETLNLPQTDFPMKAGLPQKEPQLLKFWEDLKLYEKLIEKNKDKTPYIFHDGPPYANGNIHYGTILNKVLKDIVVKFKNMSGQLCEFVPGWDCHGLPIELQVDKDLGSKKAQMSPLEIRKKCKEHALKYIDIQRSEFKRLGGVGRWEEPYITMSPQYEAAIAREFGKFVEKDLVYRSKKPVFWCPSCRTALAEAEVEYANHRSPSIYVKFKLMETNKVKKSWGLKEEPVYLVIWTTTPWTLPANLAISLHPSFTYAAIRMGKEVWVIADTLLNKVLEVFGSPECEVLTKFSGKDLENLHCQHPFLPKQSLIVLGAHVTSEAGTGCVHTAPGHGQEDYVIGQKYGLEPFAPIDAQGRFTKEVGLAWIEGKKVEEANQPIIDHLKQSGALAKEDKLEHSYPHCWRCKNPILFRATEQWFVSMEKQDLRKKALRAIDNVEWIPPWGRNRIFGMVQERPDWCISRQRLWGVPIIALACSECETVHTTKELVDKAAKVFEKEGSDAWFASDDVSQFIPEKFSCPKCKKKTKFVKVGDILDVWFDSGVSFAAVLEEMLKLKEPADLYLEGSDQHRGWFHTSLLISIGTRDRAPYKRVLTHGFVVDAEGKKLSKSAKNYIPPDNVLKNQGAEMLRLWVANEDYRNDIRFSEEILTRLIDSYRKVRNTCRYMLGNLFDFTPGKDEVPYEELLELDRWALHVLQSVIKQVREAYERFEFHMIAHTLNRFCAVELSSFYFDILKDRLYTEAKKGLPRRAAQTALFKILETMTRLMAPILSFTAEEVWQASPAFEGKPKSIFLTDLPAPNSKWEDQALSERWERFFTMRGLVTKALELARAGKFLGNSLEAKVVIEAKKDQQQFLQSFGTSLPDLFIVSEVEFGKAKGNWTHTSDEVAGFKVGVEKATGKKCGRCWKYLSSVGSNAKNPDVCERCAHVLQI